MSTILTKALYTILTFYRLKNSNEALDLGIYEYLNSGNWNFIEWGEKIQELLPEEFTRVNIKVISKESDY
jgi:tRNA threonylcarbamoyladenosine biosynthesis protein TsaE